MGDNRLIIAFESSFVLTDHAEISYSLARIDILFIQTDKKAYVSQKLDSHLLTGKYKQSPEVLLSEKKWRKPQIIAKFTTSLKVNLHENQYLAILNWES